MTSQTLPRIRHDRMGAHLEVRGAPYLILGGELENSSASGRQHMRSIWPRLASARVNTVLAAVPWDLIEPREEHYEFRVIDELIEDARTHGMKLIPLWFGTWKNGLSHYVPGWVKRDVQRFPRARIAEGTLEVISPLSDEARAVDARAFSAFMKHVRSVDEREQTVVMVQVENEVGLFGGRRDLSNAGVAGFAEEVPSELTSYLNTNWFGLLPETQEMAGDKGVSRGTWLEVFPKVEDAEEAFLAWHYARHVGEVAAAGKAQYDLPMFANAALDSPVPAVPGYFLGGPVARVADIWRAAAPSIDMLCPDIYAADYNGFLAAFNRNANPLFVPESAMGDAGACNAIYTVGKGALGYSPFGLETDPTLEGGSLAQAYEMLALLSPQLAEARTSEAMNALRVSSTQTEDQVALDGYRAIGTRLSSWKAPATPLTETGACLVLKEKDGSFLVAGCGIQLHFEAPDQPSCVVGIESIDTLVLEAGLLQPDRRLSGDEIMHSYDIARLLPEGQNGTRVKLGLKPQILRVRLYTYERLSSGVATAER